MPVFTIKSPDGRTFDVTAPDGASKEEVLAYAQKQFNSGSMKKVSGPDPNAIPAKVGKDAWEETLRKELDDNPVKAKLAAAGTALSNLWEGGKQLVGAGDKEAIANNSIIASENPGSALVGNIALGAASGAAAPVLNTARGAVAGGAVMGALQPTEMDNVFAGKALNTAIGLGAGLAGNKLAGYVGKNADGARMAHAIRKSQNAPRDATIAAARDAGYTIPPTAANPTWINRTLESLAGKEATRQAASVSNQNVTNSLSRKALGMADDVGLTDDALYAFRGTAAQPYREVSALGPQAADALEQLKQARHDATVYFKHYDRSADPASLKQANSLKAAAEALEQQLEQFATAAGRPELIPALREARKQVAKSYTIERALNDSTGNVDARALAAALRGGAPLSDELETVARFASAFPGANRTPEAIGGDGVSKLKFALSALMGTSGAAAGGPLGAAAGAVPFLAPDVTRSLILSSPYQAAMATPKYGIGAGKKLAEAILASRYSPMGLAGGAVPSLSE